MRDLLDACIELDTLAVDAYSVFAETTENPELGAVFRHLQADECEHLTWWGDVRRRFDVGGVEAITTGAHVTAYMRAIVATLRTMLATTPRSLSDDDMLALAASLEFFALDPVFGELIIGSDAEAGNDRLRAYDDHIERLAVVMEARGSWTLAPHIALLRAVNGPGAKTDSAELHDSVTGLPRRSIAEEAIADLCADPDRDDEDVSLALLEISLGSLYQRDPVGAERQLLHIVSAVTSLLKFTDLLARIDTHRFAVVMPATSSGAAGAIVSAIADAISSIATAAAEGVPSKWVSSVVVTLPPGRRCDAADAFAAAEGLLGELRESGEAFASRVLS